MATTDFTDGTVIEASWLNDVDAFVYSGGGSGIVYRLYVAYNGNPIENPPDAPTGDGTTDGWYQTSTNDSTWMSQKISLTAMSGEWGTPIQIVGATGATGAAGSSGIDGNQGIIICAFKWANSAQSVPTQATNYTWATGVVSAYPAGWTATSDASPGAGYTLYQLNLTITDVVTATSTDTNWSASALNIVGYTEAGTTGTQGDSAKIAYCKSTIASPTGTTTSTGAASLPAVGSFGLTGSVFATSPPVLSTGEYLYQTDGIYVAGTNTISWATPYLSNLKVGSLSAISADLGTITAGSISGASLTVGTSPAVSGTTMTGAGAIVNTDGTFALGNATTNVSYNGTQMTLNGNVVATANIGLNAVTLTASAFTSAIVRNTNSAQWEDVQTITITTNGAPVYVTSSGTPVDGSEWNGSEFVSLTPQFRLVRDAVALMYGAIAMSYSETPAAGTYVYRLQVLTPTGAGSVTSYAGASNRSLFAIETKR